jgi:hypothetical protein
LNVFSKDTAAVKSHETSTALPSTDVDAVENDNSNTTGGKNSLNTIKGISPEI